jgi:hypothetical protein
VFILLELRDPSVNLIANSNGMETQGSMGVAERARSLRGGGVRTHFSTRQGYTLMAILSRELIYILNWPMTADESRLQSI